MVGRRFSTTIGLFAVVVTLIPVLWTALEKMTVGDHWGSGLEEFSTKEINYFKTFLRDGGEIWIGTDPDDRRVEAAIRQGDEENQRAQREGCMLSVKPTCEGDVDLISQIDRDPKIFLPRTGNAHETVLTVRYYKYVRKVGEVAVTDEDVPSRSLRDAVEVVKGTTWFGVVTFYITRMPGHMAVKIPLLLLVVSLISRFVGCGALVPLWTVLRAAWILIRMSVDLITDSDGAVDGWFWAFVISLSWPL